MDYQRAFESCRSYDRADGTISRNDLVSLCRKCNLNYDSGFVESIVSDQHGRVTLDSFQRSIHRHYYEDTSYLPTSPPPRPGSGSRMQRQSTHPSSSHPSNSAHHHPRNALKYVGSPQGHGGYERDGYPQAQEEYKRSSYRPEPSHPHTPEFVLSPEERNRPTRDRSRAQDLEHPTFDLHRPHRERERECERDRMESPPPPPLTPHLHRPLRASKSVRGEDSENESGNESYNFPVPAQAPPSSTYARRGCKYCRKLQQRLSECHDENKRKDQQIERLRKELCAAQNADLAYTNVRRELLRDNERLLRDNERLRQEQKKLNRGTEHEVDRGYLERFEELKKAKEDLEAEIMKKREQIADLKSYKREYNHMRQKLENLQREYWRLLDENQRLNVQCLGGEKVALVGARRSGDDDPSAKSTYASEPGFQRSALRQTYHFSGSGKGEVSKDTSRSRKISRLEMKRTSSAAQVLDNYEEPQKDDYQYSRPKSHRSGGTYSDASSVTEGLPLVTTTPDEQSQVFMVMGEDVSKSVLPENLTQERELALIYSLQNCHSVQEIIKCLISYGFCTPGENVQAYKVENEYLTKKIEHLKSRNTMLANSFENAKSNMEGMYTHAQKVEANNTRLCHALRLCYQACEVYEVLLELRVPERQPAASNPSYFPSFDYSSLESSTRSPDREHSSSSNGKPPAVLRARSLLHSLDSDTELQNFLPGTRTRSNFRQTVPVWGESSQNTGTTSGLSSMSGGMEGEITPEELERLRMYTQALLLRKNHYVSTLVPIEGLKGLETVKACELVKDCLPSNHSGQIMDLEDAANAEELCKVREEKAELRSQIYMMDQEKRRMELEVSRMLLHKQKSDKLLSELQYKLREERNKRKRDKKGGRRGDDSLPSHDPSHINQQSIELQATLERERELQKRYEDLFSFLNRHVRESQSVSEDLMTFVKEMRRANSALVDAFEKSKKRQQVEKKRMKQELVSYMNKVHHGNSIPTNDDPSSGPVYT